MDPATIVGVAVAFVAIIGSMILEGGNPAALIAPRPLFLIFVGTLGASLASGTCRACSARSSG